MFSRLLGTQEMHLRAFLRVQLVTALMGSRCSTQPLWLLQLLQHYNAGLPEPVGRHVKCYFQCQRLVQWVKIWWSSRPPWHWRSIKPCRKQSYVCWIRHCFVLHLPFWRFFIAPFLAKPLLSSNGTKEPQLDNREHIRHQLHNRYYLSFEVAKGSFLIDSTITQAGLLSVPGAVLVDTDFAMDQRMIPGNRLNFAATAAGVVSLAQQLDVLS